MCGGLALMTPRLDLAGQPESEKIRKPGMVIED